MNITDKTTGKGNGIMTPKVTVLIAAAVIIAAVVCLGFAKNKRELTVATDIPMDKITEFYYTESSSANPPYYQRYRFYTEGDSLWFYHETRQGSHWPLTEKDVTKQGTVQLTQQQIQQFSQLVAGGRVTKRTDTDESGDKGPWMYIYWDGDKGMYQQFSFADYSAQSGFESFCRQLGDI
ncbi:MAG: hypothetical protein E7484_07940 [Ruminococcaceae bacterium]|nr:hypothetical protein [Oscillospiraceae bacterium]